MTKQKIIITLLWSIFSCNSFAQLGADEEIAKAKGLELYGQNDWYDSQPLLEVAAKAGDQKAQYYLGEAIRLSKRYTTAEARKWYGAAAEQGDLYAMLRLGSGNDLCKILHACEGSLDRDWKKQAIKIARERADKGDTEAMTVLYMAGQGVNWVEKAAEDGDSYAQNLLAIAYENGAGWFLIPGSRSEAVEKWYRASAKGGNAQAMNLYSNFLYKQNRSKEEIGYWFKMAADAGHLDVIASYAMNVAHLPDSFGYPLNITEAYGLMFLVSKLKGGGTAPEDGRRYLPLIAEKMTTEEIQQGIAYAAEWEKTHPPLSYYPPVYGY